MRTAGLAVLVTGVLVVVVLTLGPVPNRGLTAFTVFLGRAAEPFGVTVRREEAEAFANVLLFIPAGAGAALLLRRAPGLLLVVLAGLASLAIEVTQASLPDRTPTLRDVALNTAGAAVGVLAARVGRRAGAAGPAEPG